MTDSWMLKRMGPWSYTSLTTFEQCPRKAFHRYVLKEKSPQTPEMIEGNRVHSLMEDAINGGEVKIHARFVTPILKQRNHGATVIAEHKFGITAELQPTGFYEGWGRGAADVLILKGPRASVFDWKTGKPREKEDQLKIMALFTFAHYPEVQNITAANVWLKSDSLGQIYNFSRDTARTDWAELLQRLDRIEEACIKEDWPMKPSPLCAWCEAKQCQHYKGAK